MRIGVLGTGDVGQALGTGFANAGHEVKMGSRDPSQEKIQDWVSRAGPNASAGTFAEAAAFGEVVVLCTLWDGTENAIRLAEPRNMAGKVVIDTLEFGSPAEQAGLDFDWEILAIEVPADRAPKQLMLIPAFLLLGAMAWLQIGRRRGAAGVAAPA